MIRRIARREAETKITEPIASLLRRFALRAERIPTPAFEPCTDLVAGAARFTALEGDVTIEGPSLQIAIPVPPFSDRQLDLRNERGDLTLRDGSKIHAKFTHWRGSSTSLRFRERTGASVTKFEMDVWCWTTAIAPRAWVGLLRGARTNHSNMWIEHGDNATADCMRFDGTYTWYVIGGMRGAEPRVLIDAGDRAIDTEQLGIDFTALEFVMGTPLQLDVLVGVDDDAHAVGAVGPHLGFRNAHGNLTYPPTPDRVDSDCWAPVLFTKVVELLRNDADRSYIAIAGYMDSFTDHLDGAYLKSQVALEAYCKSLIPAQRRLFVRDAGKWSQWVDSLAPQLVPHALPDALNTLLDKMRAAMHAHSSTAVPTALAQLGGKPPKDVLDEVKRRNIAAHEFVMTKRANRDVDEDYTRVAIIRALLGAIVARAAGYDGPVLGRQRDELGYRRTLEWWPSSPSALAAEYHRV